MEENLKEWFDEHDKGLVSYKTFYARVAVLGWSKEAAINKMPRKRTQRKFEYKGGEYTATQLYHKFCEADISLITFRNRLINQGFTTEEACTFPKNKHRDKWYHRQEQ